MKTDQMRKTQKGNVACKQAPKMPKQFAWVRLVKWFGRVKTRNHAIKPTLVD